MDRDGKNALLHIVSVSFLSFSKFFFVFLFFFLQASSSTCSWCKRCSFFCFFLSLIPSVFFYYLAGLTFLLNARLYAIFIWFSFWVFRTQNYFMACIYWFIFLSFSLLLCSVVVVVMALYLYIWYAYMCPVLTIPFNMTLKTCNARPKLKSSYMNAKHI